jgi:hypothetical protein
MITLTEKEWIAFKPNLEAEYGRTIILIRSKMKDILGCTYRYGEFIEWPERNVFLDFHNESAESFFRLKYL